jgi:hypothetical protein
MLFLVSVAVSSLEREEQTASWKVKLRNQVLERGQDCMGPVIDEEEQENCDKIEERHDMNLANLRCFTKLKGWKKNHDPCGAHRREMQRMARRYASISSAAQ